MNSLAKARGASIAALVILVFIGWVALRGYQFLSVPSFPLDLGPDPMQREFFALAGLTAVDCGRVTSPHDPSSASKCAMNAFESKKAFVVRYDFDSQIALGLAGNVAGYIFAIAYDRMGWSGEGISWPSVRSTDHYLIITPCPRPVRLRKTAGGGLTCFPPDPNAKPNIMSPNAEPY